MEAIHGHFPANGEVLMWYRYVIAPQLISLGSYQRITQRMVGGKDSHSARAVRRGETGKSLVALKLFNLFFFSIPSFQQEEGLEYGEGRHVNTRWDRATRP